MSESTDDQLPPQLDWDNMETGILKKMGDLQAKQNQQSSWKNKSLFLMSLISLGVLLIFSCIYFGKKNTLQNDMVSVEMSNEGLNKLNYQKSQTDNELSFSINPSNNSSNNNSLANESIQLKGNDKNVSKLEKTSLNKITYSDNSTTTHLSTPKQIISTIDSHHEFFLTERNDESDLIVDREVNELPSQQHSDEIDEIKEYHIRTKKKTANSIVSISSLSPLSLFVERQLDEFDNFKSRVNTYYTKRKNSTNRLTVLGGVSFWDAGYGNTKPMREQFEKNILSFHSSLNFIHTSKNNFSLMVGLQYQQLQTKFDWSATIDDYQLVLKDTIIEVVNNINAGTQTQIRGDVELTVSAERRIRHFNKTKLFQIPFAIGKTWTLKKWQAGVFIGGSLNILSKNTGRTFYQGEIQNFDGSSTDFLNNQMKFNGLAAGRLTYYLNKNFGITSGLQFQKSLSNWSTETDIDMRPNIINLDFGITYIFNTL